MILIECDRCKLVISQTNSGNLRIVSASQGAPGVWDLCPTCVNETVFFLGTKPTRTGTETSSLGKVSQTTGGTK